MALAEGFGRSGEASEGAMGAGQMAWGARSTIRDRAAEPKRRPGRPLYEEQPEGRSPLPLSGTNNTSAGAAAVWRMHGVMPISTATLGSYFQPFGTAKE